MPLVTIETAQIQGNANEQEAIGTGFEMDVYPENIISIAEIYDNLTDKTVIAYDVRFIGDKMPIHVTKATGDLLKAAFE